MRKKAVIFRLCDKNYEIVKDLADKNGITMAGLVRQSTFFYIRNILKDKRLVKPSISDKSYKKDKKESKSNIDVVKNIEENKINPNKRDIIGDWLVSACNKLNQENIPKQDKKKKLDKMIEESPLSEELVKKHQFYINL